MYQIVRREIQDVHGECTPALLEQHGYGPREVAPDYDNVRHLFQDDPDRQKRRLKLIRSLPKTSAKICLPAPEALDKLALAQADVGRSFSTVSSD